MTHFHAGTRPDFFMLSVFCKLRDPCSIHARYQNLPESDIYKNEPWRFFSFNFLNFYTQTKVVLTITLKY